jgi:hypothetical protein
MALPVAKKIERREKVKSSAFPPKDIPGKTLESLK